MYIYIYIFIFTYTNTCTSYIDTDTYTCDDTCIFYDTSSIGIDNHRYIIFIAVHIHTYYIIQALHVVPPGSVVPMFLGCVWRSKMQRAYCNSRI